MIVAAGAQFDQGDVWLIAAVVVLLAADAFLSAAEAALARISAPRAAALAAAQHRSGRALVRLVEDPYRYANGLLLMSTIVRLGAAFIVALVARRYFGPWGLAAAFVLLVLLIFTIGEVIPKTLATLEPNKVALAAARPVAALTRIVPLGPVTRLLIGLANVVVPGRGLARGPFVSEQELLGIVGAAVDDDVIEHEERELIASVIGFGDTVARLVMVPRLDMVTVDASATVRAALDRSLEEGYSRLPVIGDSSDDILGVLHVRDLIQHERAGRSDGPVTEVMHQPHFVPETKPLAKLMREMQSAKFHMALLVDEYGGIAGLVTLEDCLEQLVGDIADEYDTEEEDIIDLGDGVLLVDGGLAVGELNERLSVSFPDDGWDTVGGLVFGVLGHVPAVGESVESEGFLLVTAEMDGRRVSRVRVQSARPSAEVAT